MKESYEFVAIFSYEDDGINIRFPDLEEAISYAETTKEALKNAKEVLELVLYNREEEEIKIPKSTPLEKIKCKENEKTVTVSVWMPLVRNEMEEQAVKKTLTIPQWLNKLAEAQNVNFSKVLQSALKEYLKIKRIL
ncbi:MAG: type II toxin-antitoxin system HicB family antitoxin [Clostridia bacterium]|nr:type II toxin-antitoxin system HicB family antitoxin [Clostridia bacterium]